MKKLLLLSLAFTVFALAAVAPPASAGSRQVFTKQLTNLKDTTGTATVFDAGILVNKTIVFQTYTTTGATKAMQGTAALNCGPTSTGPFVPARDIGGAIITTTANASFDINSLCRFLQVSWTKTNNRLSTWLFYSEQ